MSVLLSQLSSHFLPRESFGAAPHKKTFDFLPTIDFLVIIFQNLCISSDAHVSERLMRNLNSHPANSNEATWKLVKIFNATFRSRSSFETLHVCFKRKNKATSSDGYTSTRTRSQQCGENTGIAAPSAPTSDSCA